MNISEMTLAQIEAHIRELEAQIVDDNNTILNLRGSLKEQGPMIGAECVVRTYSAGVHIGVLRSIEGTAVLLSNARRLWSWEGAFTLNEVATKGVGKGSRISAPVEIILLTQAIEVIPATSQALATLQPNED
jgi:hypothetical protein